MVGLSENRNGQAIDQVRLCVTAADLSKHVTMLRTSTIQSIIHSFKTNLVISVISI
jgi:hypothetical protein